MRIKQKFKAITQNYRIVWISMLFVLQMLTVIAVRAQSDSLLSVLQQEIPDTQKITLYIELAKAEVNPTLGLSHARRATEFVSDAVPPIYRARAYEELAYQYSVSNKKDSALYYSNRVLPLLDSISDIRFKAFYRNSRSALLRNLHRYHQSIECAQFAYGYYSVLLDTSQMMTSLRLMALSHDYAGNSDSALYYGFKALDLLPPGAISKEKGLCAINIASAYTRQEKHAKALRYNKLAVQSLPAESLHRFRYTLYNNMGVCHKNLAQFDSAYMYYSKALDLAVTQENVYQQSLVYVNLSGLLVEQNKDLGKAEEYAHKAVQISSKNGYTRVQINALQTLSAVYYEQGKIQSSIRPLEQGYRKALEASYANELKSIQELLSERYAATGQYKKAYHLHRDYKNLSDSLLNKEKIEEITRLELQYNFNQQRKETEYRNQQIMLSKETEISQQRYYRNLAILILGLVVMLGGGGFLFYRITQKRKQEKLHTNLFQYMQQSLSRQMNPHFFFNALTTVQSYILTNEKETSIDYISKFAGLMRKTLENSQHHSIPLQHELDVLELYVGLEKQNLQDKFTYLVSMDENIDSERYKVPAFIIQPLIENAIKHGIAPKEGNGHVKLHISRAGDTLTCSVEDDGIGRKKASEYRSHQHKSMATSITQKRLNLLNEYYSGKFSLEYQDLVETNGEIQGTRAILTLPIIR